MQPTAGGVQRQARSPAPRMRSLLRNAGRCLARPACASSWGAPVEFLDARVRSASPAAEGLTTLLLSVPPGVLASYTTPGQFLQVRVGAGDKPAFMAIASPVGDQELELLVRRTPTTEALCGLAAGGALQVSTAQGAGFRLGSLQPPGAFPSVLLFATGSGLSPIRALLDTPGALRAEERGGVQLWLGVRSPAHLPFRDRLDAWRRSGVAVTTVFSQPEAEGGRRTYVQDAFAAGGGVRGDPAATGAVLVGQKAMFEALTAALTAAGVPKERILSNY